jgi:hypothetical protein
MIVSMSLRQTHLISEPQLVEVLVQLVPSSRYHYPQAQVLLVLQLVPVCFHHLLEAPSALHLPLVPLMPQVPQVQWGTRVQWERRVPLLVQELFLL